MRWEQTKPVSSPEAIRDAICFNSIPADKVPQLSPCECAPGCAFRGPSRSATTPWFLFCLLPDWSGREVGNQKAADEVTDSCRETRHVHTLQRKTTRGYSSFLLECLAPHLLLFQLWRVQNEKECSLQNTVKYLEETVEHSSCWADEYFTNDRSLVKRDRGVLESTVRGAIPSSRLV